MRNVVTALGVLALVSITAPAQSPEWANKLFIKGSSHDFGSVPRGAQLFHRFEIQNPYAVRLELSNIRTSCGCVAVTPANQTLEPRQKAYVDVTMDARRFTGPKTVSIHISVGPEYTSTATLQVSGNSRADVVFNPGEVNFGVVPRGQSPVQTIDVEYAGNLDWRVSEVVKNSAPLDVSLEEVYRRVGQVGYRVRVTLKPDAPAGPMKQEVHLKTNDPATPLVPVLIEANVQSVLSAAPGTVAFGGPKVGQVVNKMVVVKGNRPFKIMAIEGLGEGLEADMSSTPTTAHTVSLKFTPPKSGPFKRQLLIRTDLESSAATTVNVEGNVVP
jgi:hypothetical protein